MRKERKIINTNIRLNLCDEQDRQAWEYRNPKNGVLSVDASINPLKGLL